MANYVTQGGGASPKYSKAKRTGLDKKGKVDHKSLNGSLQFKQANGEIALLKAIRAIAGDATKMSSNVMIKKPGQDKFYKVNIRNGKASIESKAKKNADGKRLISGQQPDHCTTVIELDGDRVKVTSNEPGQPDNLSEKSYANPGSVLGADLPLTKRLDGDQEKDIAYYLEEGQEKYLIADGEKFTLIGQKGRQFVKIQDKAAMFKMADTNENFAKNLLRNVLENGYTPEQKGGGAAGKSPASVSSLSEAPQVWGGDTPLDEKMLLSDPQFYYNKDGQLTFAYNSEDYAVQEGDFGNQLQIIIEPDRDSAIGSQKVTGTADDLTALGQVAAKNIDAFLKEPGVLFASQTFILGGGSGSNIANMAPPPEPPSRKPGEN